MDTLVNFEQLQKVLVDLANDIRDNYKEHLAYSDRWTEKGTPTGYDKRLIESVRTQVVAGNAYYEVTLTLNDYWKWVEEDTRPHFPPPNKILEWVQIKPVIPRPNSRGKVPSQKSLAFLIGRAIAKHGTKGSHDLQKVKDGVIPWYRERIEEALGHDMGIYIRKVFRDEA